MNLYEVLVEETKVFVTHVEAESIHDAVTKALTGDCRLVDTKPLPPKAKPPKKLEA